MLFILGRPSEKPGIWVMTIKNGRKVVIIIAEGPSDEEALYPFLKELGKPHNIRFEITHGDVLSDTKNATKSHKNIVGGIVSTILKKNRFLKEDILLVAQITDTDGVFISDDCVIIDGGVERMAYRDGEIAVANDKKYEEIIKRNQVKSSRVKALVNTPFTLSSIPYQMYYFSCNLDHVLHGQQFIGEKDKVGKAEAFASSQSGPEFKSFISEQALYEGESYEQSWEFIFAEANSLKRCTNFGLFLEELESTLSEGN